MTWRDDLTGGLTGPVLTDPDVAATYGRDQTPLLPAGHPSAVCFPTSTVEVAHVLRVAAEARVPVVPRGAGSGLSGGANAADGCIVLCTTRMDTILEVDAADQVAIVQPGVLNVALKRAATDVGLHYPPDPASYEFCTLGGNIATNAGGLCCVKYGVTRDHVLGLEVVLASGEVLRTGRRTVKGVAGYDLTGLFVGSEGTLGVVTEATLRLRPAPRPASTLTAFFPTAEAAATAVVAIGTAGLVPSLLELVDQLTLRAVEDWQRMELDTDAAALLLAQSDNGPEAARDVQEMERLCLAAGASYVANTDDAAEGSMLLAARRFAYPALERLGSTLLDDVAVPRSRIPDLLTGVQRIAADEGTVVGTFGHAGDGNFHPTIVYDATDELATAAARRTFDAIVRLALDLGGTITGEHGVGLLKRDHLLREIDQPSVDLSRGLKELLDPVGILNPGKVLG